MMQHENFSAAVRVDQANGARLIYSLFETPPNCVYCRLINGFYFAKIPRSDERVRFTEREMLTITRTVLFMYVFNASPNNSMLDMINFNNMDTVEIDDLSIVPKELTTSTAVHILDTLFGENFSMIVRRPIRMVMMEYIRNWRYYGVGETIQIPSIDDFIKVYRFVNVASPSYSQPTAFVNNNSADHKIHLQKAKKLLL